MTIIVLTNCPLKLRGDLTKWFMEINTGVYVGNVSSRVRDKLWGRICDNIKNGQTTMVFSANNEQHMDFRVHNTSWMPVDYDGIKLMLRPSTEFLNKQDTSGLTDGFSNAVKYRKVQKIQASNKVPSSTYAFVDVETTSLKPEDGNLIEISAVIMGGESGRKEFCRLIKVDKPLEKNIVDLTGITDKMLEVEGVPLRVAMVEFMDFVNNYTLVFHNASFDMAFLRKAFKVCGLSQIRNKTVDTLMLARKKLRRLPNYRLETIAEHLGIKEGQVHRALPDSILTAKVYEKLKEI